MQAVAVVLERPERIVLRQVELTPPSDEDVVVDVEVSGISTGTERLLWQGSMPEFPGMGYPLVPGYESVGVVQRAGSRAERSPGERVFVPGARCFGELRALFGGAASRLVVPGKRTVRVDDIRVEEAALLALAATAHHAIVAPGAEPPELIVGHGVLGRLLARITIALGAKPPVVWECKTERMHGALGYQVLAPEADARRDYRTICDASGDASMLDSLIGRLAPGGEVVLAGFYSQSLTFAFAPAFMREARLRVAAQWQERDLLAVTDMTVRGTLGLAGLITHRKASIEAPAAYRQAFDDAACLKMVLDWRSPA